MSIPHNILVLFRDKQFCQGCARLPEILQNFIERQILLSLCLVVFHALTFKLPIQVSPSVAPKLPVLFCVQLKIAHK